jgi:hypothetical protein
MIQPTHSCADTVYRGREAYKRATPLAKAFLASGIGVLKCRMSTRDTYKIGHPSFSSEAPSEAIQRVATEAITTFPGPRHKMLKKIREFGRGKNFDFSGPFREGDLERWTLTQAPCQNSGSHQTAIDIYCQPSKF